MNKKAILSAIMASVMLLTSCANVEIKESDGEQTEVEETKAEETADTSAGTVADGVFSVGDVDITVEQKAEVWDLGGERLDDKVVIDENGSIFYRYLTPANKLIRTAIITNEGTEDAYVRFCVKLNNKGKIVSFTARDGNVNDIFTGSAWGISDKSLAAGLGEDDNRIIAVDTYLDGGLFAHDGVNMGDEVSRERQALTDGIMYVYYIRLEAGESETLDFSMEMPAYFNGNDMEIFDGLSVGMEYSAVQADGFDTAKAAFEELERVAPVIGGGVDIVIHEDNDAGLIDEEYKVWVAEQILVPSIEIEKDVWVENQGSNPAYVRVYAAMPYDAVGIVKMHFDGYHENGWTLDTTGYKAKNVEYIENGFVAEVGGEKCIVYCFTLKEPLEAGEKSGDCLTAVSMYATVDCSVGSDGGVVYYNRNDDGKEYSMTLTNGAFPFYVYAEAVPVNGFATPEAAFDAVFHEFNDLAIYN